MQNWTNEAATQTKEEKKQEIEEQIQNNQLSCNGKQVKQAVCALWENKKIRTVYRFRHKTLFTSYSLCTNIDERK